MISKNFKLTLKKVFFILERNLKIIGIDIWVLLSFKNYLRYQTNRQKWLRQGGKITKNKMCLSDYDFSAGITNGHYFHQDLLVANMIFNSKPKRHLDVGSRFDGFIAHVASFREIEVLDIRSIETSPNNNIKFVQADLMNPYNILKTDSLSCLHAIEHFGLGRYTDPIDINGHIKGINNLVSLVEINGYLYISFPIGRRDEVHFNAHRVFHPKSILKIKSIENYMELVRFDYIDDIGKLHLDKNVESITEKITYGCGIYTFKKTK